jgi:hypothetical protein
MNQQERMSLLANKLLDGVDWGDLPWDWEFTDQLYLRLDGQILCVSDSALETKGKATIPNFSAASVNEDFLGASSDLAVAINFTTAPEGPEFWKNVFDVFVEIEKAYLENCNEQN